MSLSALFYPKSVALVGASKDLGSVGNEIAKNLTTQGYKGKVFFVNPKSGKLFGKKVFEDTNQLPENIDLAIVAIPSSLVNAEVLKLSAKKIKSLVVISAGFKEVGNTDSEAKLAQICTQNNITLIGPNCLGFINPEVKLNSSFAPIMPSSGSIAFISQSGALCASVLDYAAKEKIGFSKFISIGNKAQTTEVELLEYLKTDAKTKIIAMYVEELEKIEALRKISSALTSKEYKKPIVVLKSGKTSQGKKAAMSHTGAIGASDDAYESLFRQTGMIRAESIEELFNIIEAFQRNRIIKNNRIAIITNAGGPGVLTADAMVTKGLKLAKLSESSKLQLQKILPLAASTKNPIDILGDADSARYQKTLQVTLSDANVDGVEVILTPQSMTEIEKTAKVIANTAKNSNKPVIATFMGQELVEPGVDILNKKNITTTLFPESAASSFSALNLFAKLQEKKYQKPFFYKKANKKLVKKILEEQTITSGAISTLDVFKILKAYGMPMAESWLIKNEKQASSLAQQRQDKLVLKIISPNISHKTEVGGVVLNVEPKNLAQEFTKLIKRVKRSKPKAQLSGVLVMPQIENGLELIVGAKTDGKLGKQVMVGLGGIYTEVLKDVSWGLAPLKRADIKRMISTLKISKILSGIRGHEPYSQDVAEDTLGKVSQLVCDFPQIAELDINPLIVMEKGKGAYIVDARISL